MRLIIRLLSLIFVLFAMGVLAVAIYVLLSDADMSAPAGQLWTEIDASSLNLAEAIVDRYVAPAVFYPDVWYDAIVPLLGWPAWKAIVFLLAVSTILGLLLWKLAGIGRGRRAT